MHGPTFMGNALACSCANASLDLFENEDYQEKVAKIEVFLQKNLKKVCTYYYEPHRSSFLNSFHSNFYTYNALHFLSLLFPIHIYLF